MTILLERKRVGLERKSASMIPPMGVNHPELGCVSVRSLGFLGHYGFAFKGSVKTVDGRRVGLETGLLLRR
jgi:hypothetical protein